MGNQRDYGQLGAWAGRRRPVRTRRASTCSVRGGLRFAFYGRMSTAEYQDRFSSAGWQREAAAALIIGHGEIVAEYFDTGASRRLEWTERPVASALLADLTAPGRQFDAIVVGEYERAFCGNQLTRLSELLDQHGVQLWVPEAGGPLRLGSAEHQMLVTVLGAQSQREVLRSRHRTLTAMRIQVREQGRYQGGRPLYGYRLVDAGPHPNRAHARWGRRLRRLDLDPATALHVRWMFARRLDGWAISKIARTLNERGVPCPSQVDRARNRHRSATEWTDRTVGEILGNPRYTGYQVWNRQGTERLASGPGKTYRKIRHRNQASEWEISAKAAHPALVSEEDFITVQGMRVGRQAKDGSCRTYWLSGHLVCGICARRMDAHWGHGRPAYRCRHGHTSAKTRDPGLPRNLYVREDQALAAIMMRLGCSGPDEAAARVRDEHLVIIYDGASWVVQAQGNAQDPAWSGQVVIPFVG